MNYNNLIQIANKRQLLEKEHKDFFKPLIENKNLSVTTLFEAKNKAKYFTEKQNTEEKQHIWTVLNDNSSKFLLLSGIHYHNSIGYVVCKTPLKIDNPSWTIEAVYMICNK